MLALAMILGITVSSMSLPAAPVPHATSPCTGAAPPPGAVLDGPVLHVLDGVTLCVAMGTTPVTWVPLELSNARKGAESRGTLMAVAFSQNVTCRVVGASGARRIADCLLNDSLLTEQIEDSAAIRAGLSWR